MNSLLSSILPVSPRFWPEHGIEVSSLETALSDFPSGDHHPVFPRQLDRHIYEQIPAGFNEMIVSHDRFDTCPRHLRPQFIAVKARCTRNEAIQLADALAVLDADEKLANEIFRWVRHRGAETTLSYLHKFVVAVAEVESETPDDLADIPTGKLREYAKALGEPPRFGRHHVLAAVQRAEEGLIDHTEPETISYHKLGDDCNDDCPDNDWISRQPPWFQMLLAKVQECRSVDELKEMGKAVFASNVTGDRASVFWSFYNIRKRYLESRLHLSRVARDFISRIRSAGHSQLGAFGRNLYKLQRGLIKGPLFRPHEWSAIWAAYNEAKSALPAKAA